MLSGLFSTYEHTLEEDLYCLGYYFYILLANLKTNSLLILFGLSTGSK
jgi:hypothetical protein